jgi:deoxyribodipyrimidine photolyase-related protein
VAGPVGTLRLVLGDQLSPAIAALRDLDTARDVVCLFEVTDETRYVKHHKQKIALILSAMRHFAALLEAKGVRVRYVKLDDAKNSGSLTGEMKRAVGALKPERIVATFPGEWRVAEMMEAWCDELGLPVEIREDDRFFASRAFFRQWAAGKKSLRMEFFYREMRKRTGYLMEPDGKPAGAAWNFDKKNRKPPKAGLEPPKPPRFAPDAVTGEVMKLVEKRFAHHFGGLETFGWAVTRKDAKRALKAFVEHALPRFGDYQDAMLADEPFLFHSLLSPALNIGLLDPAEVCDAAAAAYAEGRAPLNAVEGFIRQILGWREYVRGLYWLKMPAYAETNVLGATRALPDFYWSAETDMRCLAQAIGQTRDHAYAHHIQRLMVTGNFALLAGLDPHAVEEWYLAVYADAFEWVELPNTHGMALFADGGVMASKPYAASGKYIDRMSDYCSGCAFDPKLTVGERACPFNALYWHFLDRHRDLLASNPRIGMIYGTLNKMSAAERETVLAQAENFLRTL